MPTVARIRGYRFFFFSNEDEPSHIHVERAECSAKFWLAAPALASNIGFRSGELTELYRIVRENQVLFQERWDEYFRD
jgi:hypothetical protein